MRKQAWIIFAAFVLYTLPSVALPTVVPDPIRCVRDLELHFFDPALVNQALDIYNIQQELWYPINQMLLQKSLEVPQRIKRRTAYMVPNPIEYPMQMGAAAAILKEVLFEVFLETMRFYQANERPAADYIFEYMFSRQFPKFVRCFGEEAKRLQPKFD
jgi:hypothetical protein